MLGLIQETMGRVVANSALNGEITVILMNEMERKILMMVLNGRKSSWT